MAESPLPVPPDAPFPVLGLSSVVPEPPPAIPLPAAAVPVAAPTAGVTASFGADAVFEALADRRRRRILELLFTKGECAAAQLKAGVGRSRSVVGKHLATLCRAGLVVATGLDPNDKRQRLYTLAPALRAQDVARGELDFGCGVLRFR